MLNVVKVIISTITLIVTATQMLNAVQVKQIVITNYANAIQITAAVQEIAQRYQRRTVFLIRLLVLSVLIIQITRLANGNAIKRLQLNSLLIPLSSMSFYVHGCESEMISAFWVTDRFLKIPQRRFFQTLQLFLAFHYQLTQAIFKKHAFVFTKIKT